MASFKTSDTINVGENITLVGDELHHAKTVRRLSLGERLEVSDEHTLGSGTLVELTSEQAVVRIDSIINQQPQHITLAVAITKKPAMEEVVQHATELGVKEIIFFESAHSPIALDEIPERLIRIAKEASKQANRPAAPSISLYPSLGDVLGNASADIILYGKQGAGTKSATGSSALIVVGPEGGLTPEEEDLLHSATAVSLSPFTLRTPTAALSLVAYANTLLGEK